MKKIISNILLIVIAISVSSCVFEKNVDEKLIETSNGILGTWNFEEGRTFSVFVDEENIYHIDINGKEKQVKFQENDITENIRSNICECDLETMKIVDASKSKVLNYINKSDILRDKEILIAHINDVRVAMADFSIDEASEYDFETNTIFINNTNSALVGEWDIIHELVHALYYKTNNIETHTPKYYNTLFTEVLTDIITDTMEPEIDSDTEIKYFSYYLWIYLYLGCVDFDGIEAFFYGYETLFKYIPQEELDVFVESLKNEKESEDAIIILTNCINDGGLEYPND